MPNKPNVTSFSACALSDKAILLTEDQGKLPTPVLFEKELPGTETVTLHCPAERWVKKNKKRRNKISWLFRRKGRLANWQIIGLVLIQGC